MESKEENVIENPYRTSSSRRRRKSGSLLRSFFLSSAFSCLLFYRATLYLMQLLPLSFVLFPSLFFFSLRFLPSEIKIDYTSIPLDIEEGNRSETEYQKIIALVWVHKFLSVVLSIGNVHQLFSGKTCHWSFFPFASLRVTYKSICLSFVYANSYIC